MKVQPLTEHNILEGLLEEINSPPESQSYVDTVDPKKETALTPNPSDNQFQNTFNASVKLSETPIDRYPAAPVSSAAAPLINWPRFAVFAGGVYLIFKILKKRRR